MSDQHSFKERIKHYTLRELEDVADAMDKEHYPERYNLVLDEIEERKGRQSLAKRISGCTVDELEEVANSINKEQFPGRYHFVLNEIEERRNGAHALAAWEAEINRSKPVKAPVGEVVEYSEAEIEKILEGKYHTLLRRIASSLIDFFLLLVPSVVISAAFGFRLLILLSVLVSRGNPSRTLVVEFLVGVGVLLMPIVYRIIQHYRLQGQTIGKRIMKVRLVSMNGGKATSRQALLRETLALVALIYSILISLPLVGVAPTGALAMMITMVEENPLAFISSPLLLGFFVFGLANAALFLFHPQHRTLDDLIAGTVVVRNEAWKIENGDSTK